MNIWRIVKIAVIVLLLGLLAGFLVWSSQVMSADQAYVNKVRESSNVKITETDHSFIMSSNDFHSKTGVVFIPGARVDPKAYFYKLSGIVENMGITVVITKPYFNLALFDLRPIASFTNDVNNVEKWYVAGHSLGGVRACQYAADQSTHVAGLILFGSYCDTDVTVTTYSVTAGQDKLTNKQDIDDHSVHFKGDITTYEIPDASHASFGDYGKQSGDGDATIDSEFMRLDLTDQLGYWFAQQ